MYELGQLISKSHSWTTKTVQNTRFTSVDATGKECPPHMVAARTHARARIQTVLTAVGSICLNRHQDRLWRYDSGRFFLSKKKRGGGEDERLLFSVNHFIVKELQAESAEGG